MDTIILIGCGEQARVVIDNIEEQGKYKILGLVTNNNDELNTKVMGYSVLCLETELALLLKEHKDIAGYFLTVGIRNGMKRRYIIYSAIDNIIQPVNVIHPSTTISKHCCIGKGNLIEAYTKVANGVTIGNHCIINSFTAINHDQFIGDNVLIAGNVSMAGKSVGSHTIIADGASIGFKKKVGVNCIIGDGAVVTKDMPDNIVAVGNPARIVRENPW